MEQWICEPDSHAVTPLHNEQIDYIGTIPLPCNRF